MEDSYARFTRHAPRPEELLELAVVDGVAQRLRLHLIESLEAIREVHVHGAASRRVQDIVSQLLTTELGFDEEVVLTPEFGFVTRARPDFFFRLGERRGILAEVERGGTTTNNHDLKDLWKTHIAPDAQHLFLVVPLANWNASGATREKPFIRVRSRLGAFFGDPRREVDVLSVHVFGYGATTVGAPVGATTQLAMGST
jgi:hypothetical protein